MTPTHLSHTNPRISVSTWSLHRTLGDPRLYGPENTERLSALTKVSTLPKETEALPLLELPARLAAFGIHTVEICHFHLPSLDAGYLKELRATLEHEHVELFSVLIDAGDITHPVYAERDRNWIDAWIEIAGQLGATCSRVIAGKASTTPATLQTSMQGLQRLADSADAHGVRVMTENWFDLLSQPSAVHTVFEQLHKRIGLCFDFGNWSGPNKYENLRSIASYAESCHAKAHFSAEDVLDTTDYTRCLDITREAGFSGPYTLIYDGPNPDEWAGLAREREIIAPYLQK